MKRIISVIITTLLIGLSFTMPVNAEPERRYLHRLGAGGASSCFINEKEYVDIPGRQVYTGFYNFIITSEPSDISSIGSSGLSLINENYEVEMEFYYNDKPVENVIEIYEIFKNDNGDYELGFSFSMCEMLQNADGNIQDMINRYNANRVTLQDMPEGIERDELEKENKKIENEFTDYIFVENQVYIMMTITDDEGRIWDVTMPFTKEFYDDTYEIIEMNLLEEEQVEIIGADEINPQEIIFASKISDGSELGYKIYQLNSVRSVEKTNILKETLVAEGTGAKIQAEVLNQLKDGEFKVIFTEKLEDGSEKEYPAVNFTIKRENQQEIVPEEKPQNLEPDENAIEKVEEVGEVEKVEEVGDQETRPFPNTSVEKGFASYLLIIFVSSVILLYYKKKIYKYNRS